MTNIGRLRSVVFDAPAIDALTSFYTELTGWPISRESDDRITMQTPAGQHVVVDDLDMGEAQALQIGASQLHARDAHRVCRMLSVLG